MSFRKTGRRGDLEILLWIQKFLLSVLHQIAFSTLADYLFPRYLFPREIELVAEVSYVGLWPL